jgi:ATP-binding cassette subfamily B protein
VKPSEDIPSPRWGERIHALKNIPRVMKFVWEAAPAVVVGEAIARVTVALIPLSMLIVTRSIIDAIYAYKAHQTPLPGFFVARGP